MKLFRIALLLLLGLPAGAQPVQLLVGTYTRTPGRAGIFIYRFDPQSLEATATDSAMTVNPSYLAPGADGKYVYAVSEQGGGKGAVRAYRLRKGRLEFINEVPSGGDAPCYITVDRKGRNVIAGNYSGGNLALFATAPDGGLVPFEYIYKHNGSGPHAARQEGPHVHSTNLSPDERYLLAADLGTDRIITYSVSARQHRLAPTDKLLQLRRGTGPRQLEFHPNGKWVYIVQELSGDITACTYDNGMLKPFQEISLLPDAGTPASSADIHVSPDGRFVYATNRNPSNHIAIFAIGTDGSLTATGHVPTGGKVPRNFIFTPGGELLLVANQDSDNISIFKVDKGSGGLTDTGKRIAAPAPVCLKWLPRQR
ncbi:lactonase family protein [Flaviaesturariibacter flavus]|uniref:Lactonase family protein n=1 Tax=Flaviaesturariibacter flavus TaxID=2502780 RepID=A0A4R1BK09_9BACT|nr:lactonase family protein [Flaviaesturariibacter flavus]TCJ17636.1 lactonase family protein [Flaviaesturariibacter flavus]